MSETALDVRRERAAKNQSIFREVNERMEELSGSSPFTSFVCECANESCLQRCNLTLKEYEAIRSGPNSFFVLPGHDIPEADRIINSSERYSVVAKVGVGAAIAEEFDSRSRAESPEGNRA